jgi:O-antigen ligase
LALILIGIGVSLGRLYLVFGPNPFNSWRLQEAGLVILLGLISAWQLSRERSGQASKLKIPKFILFGLGLYLTLHVFNAVINSATVRDVENFRDALQVIFLAPLAFFIAMLSFSGDKNTKQFLWVCFGIGMLEAGLAFIQVLSPVQFHEVVEKISPETGLIVNTYLITSRVYGIWTHSTEFGGLMAVLIPIGIYLTWDSAGFLKKIVTICGLVILFSALLASASVTPIVTSFVSILIIIFFRSRESVFHKLFGLMGLLLVGIGVVLLLSWIFQVPIAYLPLINRLDSDPTSGLTLESSFQSRMIIYQAGILLWLNNFWLGVGVGQFQVFQNSELNLTAHSVYLQTLAENGIVGAFGLLVLIATQIWLDVGLWRRMNYQERNLYLPIILISIIILSVSIFDFTFNKWNFQLLFWFSQGIIARKYMLLQPAEENTE